MSRQALFYFPPIHPANQTGTGEIFFPFLFLFFLGRGRGGRVMGIDVEIREEMEGEGDGAQKWEEGTLLAFETATVSVGDAGTDWDLVLFMYLSALLCLACS